MLLNNLIESFQTLNINYETVLHKIRDNCLYLNVRDKFLLYEYKVWYKTVIAR